MAYIVAHKMGHEEQEQTMKRYLYKRGDIWQYRRRVPADFALLDKRIFVKKSTKRRSEAEALIVAMRLNAETEAYWDALLLGEGTEPGKRYEAAMRTARALGVVYRPIGHIARDPTDTVERFELIDSLGKGASKTAMKAILGIAGNSGITLNTLLEAYREIVQEELRIKAPDQLKRWLRQRERAVSNLVKVVGDKPLTEVDRNDALRFREWWMKRITDEDLDPGSANKDITSLNRMINRIDDHYRLELSQPFARLRLGGANRNRRPPFSDEWITNRLLADNALSGLNREASLVVYVMINTGLRPSEIVALRSAAIHLDHKIPHVSVEPVERQLKSLDSERTMPLVGCSLVAMRKAPDGFPRYRGKGDSLSAVVNKYMKSNGLRQTPAHTIYGLRHSFEDRLTATEPPDRIAADLMGHKYVRPKYGRGASLEQTRKWLLKIAYSAPASLKAL